ncbi:DUF4937 domain-containing protein [Kitasatospora brasiliensis]|uniref:DUF4937 domain-containing protein n=1 Tax=Kitasatospora brasiliensis TaxID=3058040 RepID=UPI002931D6C5|nr:DUF4937 domain-containing protein [Kitasatospora sp. K002]
MWGKWIDCRVRPAAHEAFAAGQRRWSAISDQPGLVGQAGGWASGADRALLLALWADEPAYARFMRERHDQAAALADQRSSYTAIETATGPIVLTMPGAAPSLPAALTRATVLRAADCRLHPGRADHFLDVQREVWAPGMAAADGMLGGAVTRLAADRYLVTTLWTTPAAHHAYTARHLPALLARAAVPTDVHTLTGGLLSLEPSWLVLPA